MSAPVASQRGPRPTTGGRATCAVAIGGGHGLSRTLAGLTRVVDSVTAVVTVADDGGSSGRLRRDLDVVPPGDLRMALAALARDRDLAALVQYRFDRGELAGHSLGNLILVALRELEGDVVAALDRLARLLAVPGRVLPCSPVPVRLHGRTATARVTGQAAISATPGLERVWLEPESPPATPDAIEAIERADLVVLGPGSLYTSLLPNLLVPGITTAVASRAGPVVLVANLREQAGETEGLDLGGHLDALRAHVGDLGLEGVLVHRGVAPSGGGRTLSIEPARAGSGIGRMLVADLLDGHDSHDPEALAVQFDRVLHG